MADDITVILEADADDLLGDLSKVGLAAIDAGEALEEGLGDTSYLDALKAQLADVDAKLAASEAWEEAQENAEDLEDSFEELVPEVSGLVDALDEAKGAAAELEDAITPDELNVYRNAIEAADDATQAHQEEMKALLEVEEDVEEAVEAVVDAVQQEQQVVSMVTNNFHNYAAAVEESVTTTEELGDETEKSRGILARMGDTAKSVAGFIANMFVIDITRIPKLLEKIGKKLFGGSEEFEQLQAQLDGMLHTIGGALLPVLEGIGKGFEVVQEAVVKLSPAIRGIASRFASFASGVIESVVGIIVPAFETFLEFALEVAAQVTVTWNWLAEQATFLWTSIVTAFTGITDMLGLTGDSSKTFGDTVKGVWDNIAESTSVAWAFVQTVIENFQLAASAVIVKFALTSVTAFEEIKFFFTDVFPTALTWFGENWQAVFTDAGTFLGTALENMGTNIKEFFTQVMSWLRGDGFNFQFTGLMDGFEATVSAFPEITERQKSMLEQSLTQMDRTLSDSFGTKLQERIAENQAQLDQARNSIRDSLDMEGAVPGLTFPPEIEIKPPEKSGENDDKDTDGGDLKTNKDLEKDKDKEEGLKGSTGLAELASGIQDALFNRADPTTDAIKDGTQKSVKAMEAVAEGTKDVRKAVDSLDTRARFS